MHRTHKCIACGLISSQLWKGAAAITFRPNFTLYYTQVGLQHLNAVRSHRNFASNKSKKMMEVEPGVLVGFGNPLLDITITIDDAMLLEKYGLDTNAAIVAEEKHLPLFEELANMENIQYSAGGACQNSMRVFQWIIGVPSRAAFFGAVGDDKFAETIAKRAKADGVETHYQEKEEKATGSCAVLVNNLNRSLVANLGAAAFFTDDWLDTEENECVIERACFYYITGFFLAVSPATVLRVAKFSSDTQRTTVINMSAVFVLQSHKEQLDEVIPYVDMIIGNKDEALAFAAVHDWDTTNIFEIGKKLQALPKENGRPRIVMITDAVCPVLIFQENDKLLEYPVPKVDKSMIVDTNGCGDAYVGGFLSQLVQRMPLDYCIRAGIFASQQVLKVVGVTIDKLPKFNESCI